jgi:hypothetical protein
MNHAAKLTFTLLMATALIGCQSGPNVGQPLTEERPQSTRTYSRSRSPIYEPRIYRDELAEESEFATNSLGSTIDLTKVSVGAESATPGGEVTIDGVPAKMGKVRVGILAPDGKVRTYGMIRRVTPTRIALVAPVLPEDPSGSGDISFFVSVRGVRSPIQSLHIEALAPAPGTAVASLDKLVEVTSLTDSLPGALPQPPLLKKLINDPSNPNSLKAIYEGTAPILGGKTVNIDMIDRLLASTGYLHALETYKNAFQELTASLNASNPGNYRLQSTEADNLLWKLAAQKAAQKTLDTLAWDQTNALNETASALKIIHENTDDTVSAYMAVALAAQATALHLSLLYQASLLPSEFVNFNVYLDRRAYSLGCPSVGQWNAQLVFRSKDLRLSTATLSNRSTLQDLSDSDVQAAAKAFLSSIGIDDLGSEKDAFFLADGEIVFPEKIYRADVSSKCAADPLAESAAIRVSGNQFTVLNESAESIPLNIRLSNFDGYSFDKQRVVRVDFVPKTNYLSISGSDESWEVVTGPGEFEASIGRPWGTKGMAGFYVGPGVYKIDRYWDTGSQVHHSVRYVSFDCPEDF